MIVPVVGLPGTGKTSFAAALRPRLGPHALLLSKDTLRDELFGPDHVEYRREQDDLCVSLLHQAATYHLARHPDGHVILDGRTGTRRYQIAEVQRLAQHTGHQLRIIECVCAAATAMERLRADAAAGLHPAANRGPDLYTELDADAEPIAVPTLRLNTDAPLGDYIDRALQYLTTKSTSSAASAPTISQER